MHTQRKLGAVMALAAALVLPGCWSGDDDDPAVAPTPPASTEVPDSAGVSAAAFFSYVLGLSGSDESSEPLSLKDGFAVPADEVSEPATLP